MYNPLVAPSPLAARYGGVGASRLSAPATRELRVVENGSLTQYATFTGPAGRTYFDSDGILQTAAANVARTTYIDGNPLLLMEGARTNSLLDNRDLSTANWNNTTSNAKNKTGIDGAASTAWTVEDDNNSGFENLSQQITISDDSNSHALSVYIEKDDDETRFLLIRVALGGGTSLDYNCWLNTSTGAAQATGAASASDITVRDVGDWWRVEFVVTNNGTGNTSLFFRLFPAAGTVIGTTSSAATGSVGYDYGQVELNVAHPSSPILTTTAAVTRAAGSAALANSIISGLTEGTIYAEVYSDHLTSDAARHIAELESDANNFIRAFIASGGDLDAQITDGGVAQAALAGPAHTPGQLHKVALVFGPSGFALYSDGTQRATGTGTVPSVDTLLIGAGLYGGIKTLNVEVAERSQASAEALTA